MSSSHIQHGEISLISVAQFSFFVPRSLAIFNAVPLSDPRFFLPDDSPVKPVFLGAKASGFPALFDFLSSAHAVMSNVHDLESL